MIEEFLAPVVAPDDVTMGPQFHGVQALTVHERATSATSKRHTKIRWTLDSEYPRLVVTAEVWGATGWVLVWKQHPNTDLTGNTAEARAEAVTAAFQELEPYVSMILEP